MRSTRLTFALETGALELPATGAIIVLRPRAEDDLSMLPRERLIVVQGFRPDHDALAARGYRVLRTADEAPRDATMVLLCLPRAKAEAQGLVATALAHAAPDALIVLDGQKTDGTDRVLRALRARAEIPQPVSKAHGKLFHFRKSADDFSDWAAGPQHIAGDFTTAPGIFSADAPDDGSVMLAEALPDKLPARVVDLGAGWGYLSRMALQRSGIKELHLVEAETEALRCAQINITDPRAQFHWADATSFKLPQPVDAVICNPPFHTSRTADASLGAGFISAAARLLAPHGALWMVANRHLPYDRPLASLFREVEPIGGDARFRLIRAARPIR